MWILYDGKRLFGWKLEVFYGENSCLSRLPDDTELFAFPRWFPHFNDFLCLPAAPQPYTQCFVHPCVFQDSSEISLTPQFGLWCHVWCFSGNLPCPLSCLSVNECFGWCFFLDCKLLEGRNAAFGVVASPVWYPTHTATGWSSCESGMWWQ